MVNVSQGRVNIFLSDLFVPPQGRVNGLVDFDVLKDTDVSILVCAV